MVDSTCSAQSKKVLVLYSYDNTNPSYEIQMDGMRSVFDTCDVGLETRFFDCRRFPYDENVNKFYNDINYVTKYLTPFDGIIACDDEVFRFVEKYRDSLFRGIPVVYCGVDDSNFAANLNDSLTTGFIERIDVADNIKLAQKLIPNLKNIYFISDTTITGVAMSGRFMMFQNIFETLKFKELNFSKISYLELKNTLSTLPKNSVVFFLTGYVDQNGKHFEYLDMYEKVSACSSVPVFSVIGEGYNSGFLGGKIILRREQGINSAIMMYDILFNRHKPSAIPSGIDKATVYLFNYKQLVRFNIDQNKLPTGAMIMNDNGKQIKIYLHYLFFAIAIAFLLATALILVLRERRRAQKMYKIYVEQGKNLEVWQKNFMSMAKYSQDAISISAPDGKFIYINAAYCKMIGYTEDELYKMSIYDVRFNKVEEGVYGENLNFNVNVFIRKQLKAKGGKARDVEMIGTHIFFNNADCILTIIHDYTNENLIKNQLKSAQDQFEFANVRFKAITEQASEAITIISLNNKFIYANNMACNLLEYSADEFLDISPIDCVVEKIRFRTMVGKKQTLTLVKKNGNTFPAELRTSKLVLGGKTFYLVLFNDISERKRKEHELIRAKEKAEESNIFISEFLHNMDHELRTPMNGIIGFSELYNDLPNVNPKFKLYSAAIKESCNRLLNTITNIMEIAQLSSNYATAKNENVDLNELFLKIYNDNEPKARNANLAFYCNTRLPDNKAIILSDRNRILTILSNLVENSLKFTTHGYIEIGYVLVGKKIKMYVSDTGVGIEPEFRNKIFNKFAKNTNEVSVNINGLGLGLAICKENTRLIGGEITVDSTPGQGTTFYISIPYNTEEEHIEIKSTPISNRNSIIVAEDEDTNFLYLETMIRRSRPDYSILHAKNGAEAVELVQTVPNVKLIFLDIKMPIMSGIEAARKIHQIDKNLPIVVQTAYTMQDEIDEELNTLCSCKMQKPIKISEVTNVLNQYCKS